MECSVYNVGTSPTHNSDRLHGLVASNTHTQQQQVRILRRFIRLYLIASVII